jgi:predicted transcriptional regulator
MLDMEKTESLTNAMKNMRKEGLGRIALIKNGQLVGMLTGSKGKG